MHNTVNGQPCGGCSGTLSQCAKMFNVCMMVAMTWSPLVMDGQRSHPANGHSNSADTVLATLPLPLPRSLGHPPSVNMVGAISGDDGLFMMTPVTGALAIEDLNKYETQLRALFPWSGEYYPADSLHALQVARAMEWIARLQGVRGSGVEGRQRLPFAQVAFRAEQDSLARRLCDTRLAEVSSNPAERSLTLAVAIAIFANPTQGEARLSRNLLIAKEYTTALLALPGTGYRTQADSVSVQRRKVYALLALMKGAQALHRPSVFLPLVDRFLTIIATMPHNDRFDLVRWSFPYQAVAAALSDARGQALLDSIKARLLQMVLPRDDEWPANIPVVERATTGRVRYQQQVLSNFAALAVIGQPAPPVLAHAWFNTPDSVYTIVPRIHALDDGIVRVIAFGGKDSELLPALNRVQSKFPREGPRAVQVVFVTQTSGNAGPDVLSPPDEVAWLRSYFSNVRHSSIPVALWAGEKVANEYRWHQPTSSPVPQPYELALRFGQCVIIDGRGRIRASQPLETRATERQLVDVLLAIRDDTDRRASDNFH